MGGLFAKMLFNATEPTHICMLGLDAAGKTTVLNKLRLRKTTHTLPTIGVNVDTVTPVKDLTVTIWDVGGQSKLRQLWKHYYSTTEGVIFVVDSADSSRFVEAASELNGIFNDYNMKKVPLVVLANKQDLPGAVSVEEMEGVLQLHNLSPERLWHVQGCCAVKGSGIFEAMTVLSRFIKHQKRNSIVS